MWFKHDLGFREGAGEVDEIAELRVEHPRLEAEVERGERGKPLAPRAVEIEPLSGARGEHPQARVGVPGRAVADAAEAPAREDDVLFEDALGAAADAEIDIADDPGAGPRRAVFASSRSSPRRRRRIASRPMSAVRAAPRRGTSRGIRERRWRGCCARCSDLPSDRGTGSGCPAGPTCDGAGR